MSARAKRDSTLEGSKTFPSTAWSLIVGVQDSATMTREQALEKLCKRYWKPVCHYVRRAWQKSPEDAKDLTQGFFIKILEGHTLKDYKPERGGFRPFLKMLLRGFSADQHDAAMALKRGGGAKQLALDDEKAPLKDLLPDQNAQSPDAVFDLAWKREILERAVDRTRQWFESVGRDTQFKAFEEYELSAAPERPSYATVAGKIGTTESTVRNHLFAVRERLRAEIRAELAQTVAYPDELETEWKELFG